MLGQWRTLIAVTRKVTIMQGETFKIGDKVWHHGVPQRPGVIVGRTAMLWQVKLAGGAIVPASVADIDQRNPSDKF